MEQRDDQPVPPGPPEEPAPAASSAQNPSPSPELPASRAESLSAASAAPDAQPAGPPPAAREVSPEEIAELQERYQTHLADLAAAEYPARLTATRAELRDNILWRRLTRLRSPADLLTHPVCVPPTIGFLVGSIDFLPGVELRLGPFEYLGLILVLFAVFESVHHYFAAQRLKAMRDARLLQEMRLAGVSARDILAGAVLPYAAGQRLGIIGLVLPFVITSTSVGTQIAMGVLLLLGTWGALTAPSEDIPTVRLYLVSHSIWGAARVALAVIFRMLIFWTGLIALYIGLTLLAQRWQVSAGSGGADLLVFLVVIMAYGRVAGAIQKRRTIAFYRKHGSLTDFLDSCIEGR